MLVESAKLLIFTKSILELEEDAMFFIVSAI